MTLRKSAPGSDCGWPESGYVETVSYGDITLDLFGVFPGDTEIYEDGVRLCAADGATVGSVGARVPVKGGTHVYSLRSP